jgi:hypothetical protein
MAAIKEEVDYRDHLLELSAPSRHSHPSWQRRSTGFRDSLGREGGIAGQRFRSKPALDRTFLINIDRPGELGADMGRSIQDRNDPGLPLMKQLPGGLQVMIQSGDNILLRGTGATPGGDRPFLDRFNLTTLKSERLFRGRQEL